MIKTVQQVSWQLRLSTVLFACALSACGGGGGGGSGGGDSSGSGTSGGGTSAEIPKPESEKDVVRFLHQATFAPIESEISSVNQGGFGLYLNQQFNLPVTQFPKAVADDDAPHTQQYDGKDFCNTAYPSKKDYCWRFYYSVEPLNWSFYQQGVSAPDQLRMRVAFALSQILVVSALEVNSTYGLTDYQQMLRNNAFGNYRDLLRGVALSPVMGHYLSNINNKKDAPNENFARELLQLFSVGLCQLNMNGTYVGGKCNAVYNTETVRNYAYALTGWTHPPRPGATTASNKWNPTYLRGQMVSIDAYHDKTERVLLNGVKVPAGASAPQALDAVIDSVFNHPNLPPFVAKQMIQFLVTSNPSPEYVERVANAFAKGKSFDFGSGVRGDMKALVAAILLDPEARGSDKSSLNSFGRLRDPAVQHIGLLRQLKGQTDGVVFPYWFAPLAGQVFSNAPSVFNFYSPDFPIANGTLVGPAFGIETPNTSFGRLNLTNDIIYTGKFNPDTKVRPDATGTQIDTSFLLADAANPEKLVDRIAKMAVPGGLSAEERTTILNAVNVWTDKVSKDYLAERVKTATFLIYASPAHLIQR